MRSRDPFSPEREAEYRAWDKKITLILSRARKALSKQSKQRGATTKKN